MKLNINNTFTKELPADKILDNYRRQVVDACFSYVTPKKPIKPTLIHTSDEMLQTLGISKDEATSKEFVNLVTGNSLHKNTHPYAMCYGGHQFGNWAGQLGDGRAINLFEVAHNKHRWVLQLKGAGETPYSRKADGLAVLRSSIREYLCSEAMHHLGIPTTRALSLSLSGDKVLRDILYNGNSAYEKGAIVCRVSESFIRFGNFEILSARKNNTTLKQLADYTIKYFYPEITSKGTQKYLDFLIAIQNKTIKMIVHWQRVGFVHGVMNTDNMSILGQTIDYGPYGWVEGFEFDFTPNTTDAEHKRYKFGNQPFIGLWNIYKLANALFPLIENVEAIQEILDEYEVTYQEEYAKMMSKKLGLFYSDSILELIENLEQILHLTETDYTIFFRSLAKVSKTDSVKNAIEKIFDAFYKPKEFKDSILKSWTTWFENYLFFLQQEIVPEEKRKKQMNKVNPKYIFRNYMAQLAIENAEKEDYTLINEFYKLLKNPYEEQPKFEKWFTKRPNWARYKIGCSILSCSS